MKRITLPLILLASFLPLSASADCGSCGESGACAAERVDMPTVGQLKAQGYKSLFNGKDLTGWKVPEGDNGHWKVVDGVIDYDACSEAKGNKSLFTEEEFADYTLYFAGDGLRGLGDHCVFQYNVVKNCYDVNANHDDGFQSWTRGAKGVGSGEVVGMVLRGNTIINFEDPQQPHRGALQGIGCFDGMFVDWIIENNVVIADHYHGITLGGARNCRIVNNTVIDPNADRPGPAAIRIGKHKNGTPSAGCTIRNNLTSSLHIQSGQDMTADHNLIVDDPMSVFVDAAGRDLLLRKGSPAVDAGATDLAPKADIAGTSRPQGRGVDIGAYELPAE